jgi:caffeoyl-CoA O-methyltransferase
MNDAVMPILEELERYGAEHARMRNIPRSTGELLRILVECSGSRRILELGTSNGYSTLWLALGARKTSGFVTSVEKHDWKIAMARENIQRAGLSDIVELLYGDAIGLAHSIPGPVDFLFMDLLPTDYPECVHQLLPKMRTGSLIVADNMLSHRDAVGNVIPSAGDSTAYETLVKKNSALSSVSIPIGSGLMITYVEEQSSAG